MLEIVLKIHQYSAKMVPRTSLCVDDDPFFTLLLSRFCYSTSVFFLFFFTAIHIFAINVNLTDEFPYRLIIYMYTIIIYN